MKEKRKNDEKSLYFAEREEKAVFDYINSNSWEEKNRIYNEILLNPFRKMIQSILHRYPIHVGNYEFSEIESNALTHLIEHMVKYRPYIIEYYDSVANKWVKLDNEHRFWDIVDAKNDLNNLIDKNKNIQYRIFYSKAFSYCQTIVRNYYKDHSKRTYTEKLAMLSFDDHVNEISEMDEYVYHINNNSHNYLDELINIIIVNIENKIETDLTLKKNEIIVGDAIVNILKNWQVLFLEETPEGNFDKKITNKFAKNKILLFLKEQTGLTTKEIRHGIKPYRDIYYFEKMKLL